MENKQTVKIGAIIAAVCIVIYMGALVQATIRFYLSVENTRTTAQREFLQIADTARSAAIYGFMSQRYIEIIENAVTSSRYIEAIIITSPDGEHAVERQRGHAVTFVNNSYRFINRFSFSNTDHYRLVQIPDVRNVNIRAVAAAYDLSDFTQILRETLFIILVGFAIAFLTLLIQLLTENRKTVSVYPQSSKLESHFDNEPEMKLPEIGPKGLFSPRSNVGWEEYIKDRLESELHRSSSTEKDIAYALVEFNDLTNDSMFRQSAEEAVSYFSSRDLTFEHGRWGIAAILPGYSLESAIAKAEYFYQRIMEKFPRGFNRTTNIFIGITSRAGRLTNANRLMLEAREALKKAQDEKTSIIGFKSDPEKYREFISRN